MQFLTYSVLLLIAFMLSVFDVEVFGSLWFLGLIVYITGKVMK